MTCFGAILCGCLNIKWNENIHTEIEYHDSSSNINQNKELRSEINNTSYELKEIVIKE